MEELWLHVSVGSISQSPTVQNCGTGFFRPCPKAAVIFTATGVFRMQGVFRIWWLKMYNCPFTRYFRKWICHM